MTCRLRAFRAHPPPYLPFRYLPSRHLPPPSPSPARACPTLQPLPTLFPHRPTAHHHCCDIYHTAHSTCTHCITPPPHTHATPPCLFCPTLPLPHLPTAPPIPFPATLPHTCPPPLPTYMPYYPFHCTLLPHAPTATALQQFCHPATRDMPDTYSFSTLDTRCADVTATRLMPDHCAGRQPAVDGCLVFATAWFANMATWTVVADQT